MIPGVFYEDAYYYSGFDASFVHLCCIVFTYVIFRLGKVCDLNEMLIISELLTDAYVAVRKKPVPKQIYIGDSFSRFVVHTQTRGGIV